MKEDKENIEKSLFEKIAYDERVGNDIRRPSLTFWKNALLRFKKNKAAVISLFVLVFIALMTIVVPMISSHSYNCQHLKHNKEGPSWKFFFGTDLLGRDLFVRVFYGCRISFFIGMVSIVANLTLGVFFGVVVALFRGTVVEVVMMFAINNLYCIPDTMLAILAMVVMGPGMKSMVVTFFLLGWMNMAFIIRGEVLKIRSQDFIRAAVAMGASTSRIVFKHCVPNILGTIIVVISLKMPLAIFAEATLSFLGIGINPPVPSLGNLVESAREYMRYYPWLMIFPSILIFSIMFSFNMVGDGLRDAMDPKIDVH